MINTISYFSLDSFESVKSAAGDPSELAIASGFAALMNLSAAPVNTSIRAAGPNDPVEISIFSTNDPVPGEGEGQTGRFPVNQSQAQGAAIPQPGTNPPSDTSPADLCWDGTSWTPNPKKDFGLDIFSARRPIVDPTAIPVRLPPLENPPANGTPHDPTKKEDFGIQVISGQRPIVDPTAIPVRLPPHEAPAPNGTPRDPAKKEDFGIQVISVHRPIVDPTIPVRLPPIEPVAITKPASIKVSWGSGVQRLPHAPLWDDGTTRDPNGEKDFTIGVFTNRRPVTDLTAIPVKLPPIEPISPTKPAPIEVSGGSGVQQLPHDALWHDGTTRDPNGKKDFTIGAFINRRPVTNPAAVPVKLPPIELVSSTKPASIKVSGGSYVQQLPNAPWHDGATQDPNGEKDFTIGAFTNRRPVTDPTAVPVKLPPIEPVSTTKPDTKAAPIKLSPIEPVSTTKPDIKATPIKLSPIEPVSTTKPDIKATPIKLSPGSGAPKLPPHDALWHDGSGRNPKEVKKINLGVFNRLRPVTGAETPVGQAVNPADAQAIESKPADPAKAGATVGSNKWLDQVSGRKQPAQAVQSPFDVIRSTPEMPANDVEPGLPATIGEFHLPTDFETRPDTPEILFETVPDQDIEIIPAIEAKPEETPLLVRPRPAIDPGLSVRLPSKDPVFTKPETQSTQINTSPGPAAPIKLPPRDGLWNDGSTRGKSEMKKFNLGVFNRQRPVTDSKTGLPADLSDVAAIRANEWIEPLTGQKLTQPVDDVELGPPVMPDEFQMPEKVKSAPGRQENTFKTPGNTDLNVLAAVDLESPEKALLVRPLPIVDAAAGVAKPLLRQPFQPLKTNGTGNGENDEYRADLAQLFREVSNSFESVANQKAGIGQPGTLKSKVAGTENIINEIGGYLTEVEIAPETETKGNTGEATAAQFDKLWQPEPIGNKEIKTEAGVLTLQDAKEILDQVKPGLLELAALTAKKNEKQSMKMRLNPADLGTVEISLERNSSGALSAHFRTENEGARQALTNNLDQLRDSLQKSGWQVGQLDVSSNPSSSTADQNREHRSRQNEVAGDHLFDHRSEKPEDLEQDSSSRLLNLRA